MKKLLIIILLNIQIAFAGIIGDVEITGKLLKYDKHTVTISQGSKKKLTLPRKNVKKSGKLKTGKVITVLFTAEEIMEQISQQHSEQKQKQKQKK